MANPAQEQQQSIRFFASPSSTLHTIVSDATRQCRKRNHKNHGFMILDNAHFMRRNDSQNRIHRCRWDEGRRTPINRCMTEQNTRKQTNEQRRKREKNQKAVRWTSGNNMRLENPYEWIFHTPIVHVSVHRCCAFKPPRTSIGMCMSVFTTPPACKSFAVNDSAM